MGRSGLAGLELLFHVNGMGPAGISCLGEVFGRWYTCGKRSDRPRYKISGRGSGERVR